MVQASQTGATKRPSHQRKHTTRTANDSKNSKQLFRKLRFNLPFSKNQPMKIQLFRKLKYSKAWIQNSEFKIHPSFFTNHRGQGYSHRIVDDVCVWACVLHDTYTPIPAWKPAGRAVVIFWLWLVLARKNTKYFYHSGGPRVPFKLRSQRLFGKENSGTDFPELLSYHHNGSPCVHVPIPELATRLAR